MKTAWEVDAGLAFREKGRYVFVYTRNDSVTNNIQTLVAAEAMCLNYYQEECQGFHWGGVFRDDFAEGRRDMLKRPAITKLLEYVRPHDLVLIARLTTGPRSLDDLRAFRKELEGAKVMILDIGLTLGSPDGWALLKKFEAVLAHHQEMKHVLNRYFDREMEKRGLVPKRFRTPWGMVKKKAGRAKATGQFYYRLIVKEGWIEVGQMIQDAVDRGDRYEAIAAMLNDKGLKLLEPRQEGGWTENWVRYTHQGYQEYLTARITFARYLESRRGKVRLRVRAGSGVVYPDAPAASPQSSRTPSANESGGESAPPPP